MSFCERFRNAKFMGGMMGDIDDANPGIDPTDYGVRWDDGTFSEAVVATREKQDTPLPNPVQCVYTGFVHAWAWITSPIFTTTRRTVA